MSDSQPSVFGLIATIGELLEPLSQEDRQRVIDGLCAALRLTHRTTNESGRSAILGTGKKVSIVEYVREKQPATNAQRITVFAAFREEIEGEEYFSSEELKEYFPKARLPVPKKYARDYQGAVAEGWIHDDGARSYLTQTGTRFVTQGFEGKAKPRGKAVSKKKRTKRTSASQ